jgi:hypothetical protein
MPKPGSIAGGCGELSCSVPTDTADFVLRSRFYTPQTMYVTTEVAGGLAGPSRTGPTSAIDRMLGVSARMGWHEDAPPIS